MRADRQPPDHQAARPPARPPTSPPARLRQPTASTAKRASQLAAAASITAEGLSEA